MENIFSRTTLYDMLSMVIPGLIVMLSLAEILYGEWGVMFLFGEGLVIPKYICIFALSYLIGLFIHEIGRLLFWWSRNEPCLMRFSKKIFLNTLYRRRGQYIQTRHKGKSENNDVSMEGESGRLNKLQRNRWVVVSYFKNYYAVLQGAGTGSSISTMESQIAFLRSMFFVLPAGLRGIYEYFLPNLSFWSMILIVVGIELFGFLIMIYLQMRIYFRVFEDYYYQKIIGEKGKAVIEGEFNKEGANVKLFPDK